MKTLPTIPLAVLLTPGSAFAKQPVPVISVDCAR
jgi:hypothetical protein